MKSQPFGLYVHIPFCSAVCHYCDFAKTANFNNSHLKDYLSLLESQLLAWKNFLGQSQKFTSVFFGGGTPGLITHDYSNLMSIIREMIVPNAETTIEANPDNVTEENIKIWRELGFNRLSIGVQTFDPKGLGDLTRQHDARTALRALELAAKYFPKSNGDLIYGWHGQDLGSWDNDLKTMVSTGVNHVSLYALTYEGQTPFVRAEQRGKREQMSDDELAERYELACEKLALAGFNHEEISNWSKGQATCDHNWLYWRGNHYVGIGAGAHGFIDDGSVIGLRYSFPSDFRAMLRQEKNKGNFQSIGDMVAGIGGRIDKSRDLESWKLEYVGCGLRSKGGIDLEFLGAHGFSFNPTPRISRAAADGKIVITGQKLILDKKDWFLETAWAFEVCESLKSPII
jgi:oxygen-independent coproporphyrinogen-3 oxidase